MITSRKRAWRRESVELLPVASVVALVFVFVLAKVAVKLVGVPSRPLGHLLSTGTGDIIGLSFIACAVGLLIRWITIRAHTSMEEALALRRLAEITATETDVVVRTCNAIVREIAQPLSGILAFSDMLADDMPNVTSAQRRELDGIREGVARLEVLLDSLRNAIAKLPGRQVSAAEIIEKAVAPDIRQVRPDGKDVTVHG